MLKLTIALAAFVSLASSLPPSPEAPAGQARPSSLQPFDELRVAPSVVEGQASKPVDLSGVWVMLVEGHQIGLELEHDGTKVQGVMTPMGRRVLLTGTFVERTLTLKGERPEDGGGFSHGGSGETPGPITATLKDDGTLEGELSTNKGRTKWTGERLKTP